MSLAIRSTDALIAVDIQNDFLPGGALAVSEGDRIIPGVNEWMKRFHGKGARVILTQDWHPPGHFSFAGQHDGKKPFDLIEGVFGIGPVLWPDHCVQGTKGAEFPESLDVNRAHLIIRKGFHLKRDSYSVFTENDKKTDTGLSGYLHNAGLTRIFICGLALDYCVFWSVMDGVRKGFETIVVPDLCRGISGETVSRALKDMTDAGAGYTGLRDLR